MSEINFTQEQITDMRAKLCAAFDARIARETVENKIENLQKYRKSADHDVVASTLLACSFDVNNVNQNVYAVEKMMKLARSMTANNASMYCNALIASAVACEAQSIEITRDVIASFCSIDLKHASQKVERAIKTTRVQKHVATSTVATQHNSTINAFCALDMLRVTRNASNNDTFTLNRDNVIVQAIASHLNVSLERAEQIEA